jgi:hypothetical protein
LRHSARCGLAFIRWRLADFPRPLIAAPMPNLIFTVTLVFWKMPMPA